MSGSSTADAAEVLDCTKAKISHIETGHVPVRTPDLTALTHAYGLTGPQPVTVWRRSPSAPTGAATQAGGAIRRRTG